MKIAGHDKKVARADAWARRAITAGGLLTLVSVFAIMLFIAWEASPLISNPAVKKSGEWVVGKRLTPATAVAIGTDEYRNTAFRVDANGGVEFLSLETGDHLQTFGDPALKGKTITAASRTARRNLIAYGTADGQVGFMEVKYRADYSGQKRRVEPSVEYGRPFRLSDGGAVSLATGLMDDEGAVTVAGLVKETGLFTVKFAPGEEPKKTPVDGRGESVTALAMRHSGGVIAGTARGELMVFAPEDGSYSLVEQFKAAEGAISSLAFLVGDEALIVGDEKGGISEWFPVRYVRVKNGGAAAFPLADGAAIKPGEERELPDDNYGGKAALSVSPLGFRYMQVRQFKSHSSPVTAIAPSPRNKGFVTTGADGTIVYHYSTSGRTYARFKPGQAARFAVIGPKSDSLVALGGEGMLYSYDLDEKHPEVTLKTLFAKVWYEGYTKPEFVWQSSGGTDDFEAKLSLWPLIFGTLKGTLYAMIFSVPIAILGAIYLSQMAPTALRNVIKPLIELMAAIPSVVVGFLAGLWLAPALNDNLGRFFTLVLSVPAAWFLFVCVWWALPHRLRPETGGKRELLYILPVLITALAAGYALGPVTERVLFHGELKQWLYTVMGYLYDPRNCVVVGIALGFAVIPIIFTIAEDALSAVPPSLTSASFALAASRWQTALYVVLPAASPGIFAAVMLGLGRAVGETMIVLMATGNTPVMDLSIFNGMRAMSAAIAVEMPEAPVGGSLFRILFLTGFILFVFTFLINTVAELVSQRLRRKYARF
ncbi:MAG: ABC transporter permease subunit [Nitrospinae bacterium]|nr:ABC transporter permease subunit [Nitrospinota bacterium]